ncbi:MAG: electron transport complex subunit RsxE [Pseudomonadota bacterium]
MNPQLATLRTSALVENPAWIQLLGLCPLLAVSNSLANALGLSAASLLVILGASGAASLLRRWIPDYARLPTYLLLIATFTTCADQLLEAFAFEVYAEIALFVQIIVTNCMILGRVEQVAGRRPLGPALLDALGTGLGFALALTALGSVREILATGRLGSGLDALLGGAWPAAGVALVPEMLKVPLAALPPGAFITAGLLLAGGRWIAGRFGPERRSEHPPEPSPGGQQRTPPP